MLKQTALVEEHKKLKGRMVDFGGWELPVQYSGVLAEHTAVRTACGIFDVSHMGEIFVEGAGSVEFINWVTTNDASTLAIHQAQYSALCHFSGGIVDDLVVYRLDEQKFLLVVNASNTDKDFSHLTIALQSYESVKPKIHNASPEFSQIAVQGPKAESILQKLTDTKLSGIKTYWSEEGKVDGVYALIGRTGYTGEDGFELYLHWADAPKVWNALLRVGTPEGLLPCGLGARDTLRLEMKYALYGHELTDETNPLEVGLSWITKLNKAGTFIGKDAIVQVKQNGAKKCLVGVTSSGRALPRQGYEIYSPDQSKVIGQITSGTQSPTLKTPIGIAFIDKAYEAVGSKVLVKVREDFHEFEVVKTPFLQKNK
jgi:aminomethyltransferase